MEFQIPGYIDCFICSLISNMFMNEIFCFLYSLTISEGNHESEDDDNFSDANYEPSFDLTFR